METNQQINITPKDGELVIRHGEAPAIHERKTLQLNGHIGAVLNFAIKRKDRIEPLDTHVTIDEQKRTITLVTKEQDADGIIISGKMVEHPYIEELGVNKNKTYLIQSLIKALKLNGRYFKSRIDHATLLDSLSKFQAKTEIEFKDTNDYKGSVAQSKIVKVTHDIPLSFSMSIPIFKGELPTEFGVTIEVFPDNSTLYCQLISVDLADAMEKTVIETFAKAEQALSEYLILKP